MNNIAYKQDVVLKLKAVIEDRGFQVMKAYLHPNPINAFDEEIEFLLSDLLIVVREEDWLNKDFLSMFTYCHNEIPELEISFMGDSSLSEEIILADGYQKCEL
jgi:hypothetical protein